MSRTLFDTMLYSADFPEGFRAAIKLRGIEAGESRQPFAADHHLKMETISRSLACLLSEEGFADQPVGGCPVGGERVDPDQGSIAQHTPRRFLHGVVCDADAPRRTGDGRRG